MPINSRDVESSYLHGRSKFEEWKETFLKRWLEPETDIAVIQKAMSMSVEDVARLQAEQPEAFSLFQARLKQAIERAKKPPQGVK